ncbi:MAG: GNAT family N-acetyltransferase [Pseudomonadota bacterium]
MTYDIRHDAKARKFSVEVDGEYCELDYLLAGKIMTITHTGVPQAVGGRGIAAALVLTAFALARSEGWRVIPACSYAAVFVRRHPEYADLIASRPVH